jgi:Peptidase family M41
VAERLIFGEVSTGASNDIEKATTIARGMVTTYGMSDSLGPLALGQRESGGYLGAQGEARAYSERVAEAIDAEVRALIDVGMRQAEEILTQHQPVLDALAARLIEDETIEGDDLEQIFLGGASADGIIRPLRRYRQRPGSANLVPLPSLAGGWATTVRDGPEGARSLSLSRLKFWRGIKFEPARLLLVFGLLRRAGPKPNPALGREAEPA